MKRQEKRGTASVGGTSPPFADKKKPKDPASDSQCREKERNSINEPPTNQAHPGNQKPSLDGVGDEPKRLAMYL
jgi:hypothetical protein